MAIFTQAQGTKSASILSMGTLASATYIASSSIDLGGAIPLDVSLEIEVTPGSAPTGNKQLVVFAQLSLDGGVNFTSGPTSGTTVTNEPDMYWVGTVPCNDASTHRKIFNIQGLPVSRYIKLVVKNDMGVALTSGNVYRSDITGVST